MDFALQFGWGMGSCSLELLQQWGGGCVILSPRDLNSDQLPRQAQSIRNVRGRVLFDPQFYGPRSNHDRLTSHNYWPNNYQTNGFIGGNGMDVMLNALAELNIQLGSSAFILPGLMAQEVDEQWLGFTCETARIAINAGYNVPIYSTIALSCESMRSTLSVHRIIEMLRNVNVDGVYLLAEHPNGDYIVQDPVWLANLFEIVAALRLQGKYVLVGYSSHQQLCLAAAGASAIASGTWLNLRAFSMSRFEAPSGESPRQRGVWYYAPLTFSEFNLPMLDMAFRQGVLPQLQPPVNIVYCEQLFRGFEPTTVGFNEHFAFRHYLTALRHQALNANATTFMDTVGFHQNMLDRTQELLNRLERDGVLAGARQFSEEAFDAVRSALLALVRGYGHLLTREWGNL